MRRAYHQAKWMMKWRLWRALAGLWCQVWQTPQTRTLPPEDAETTVILDRLRVVSGELLQLVPSVLVHLDLAGQYQVLRRRRPSVPASLHLGQ